MVEKARQCTPTTVKRLHTLSGNQCAAPDCTRPLIAKDGETIISKIAHIEAASEKGPRYNPNMTNDERRHFKIGTRADIGNRDSDHFEGMLCLVGSPSVVYSDIQC